MSKHHKVLYFAVIVLFVSLSNSYVALAFISRQQNTNTPASPSSASVAPEPVAADTEQQAKNDETNATPVDAPEPTGLVYLTFDDGPDPASTPQILDILDNYGIPATFFVIGTQIEQFPDLLAEIDRRGHYVGNHTYNHKYKEVYASNKAFVRSLRQNEELIFEIIGKRPQIVRDPGGFLKKYTSIKEYTENNGYIVMGWNVDSFDSRSPVPDSARIAVNVDRQSHQEHLWPEMVILLHDTRRHQNTIDALPKIIESLLEQGFLFAVPIDEEI